ncbi:YARHG domain-containing protein [Crocinitomicaceae bacterium]|nr:YARHG domain-containing protein [Crocinitomicaceae bacterium]
MMRFLGLIVIGFLILGCQGEIKNENSTVVEENGTDVTPSDSITEEETAPIVDDKNESDPKYDHMLGFYVGDFEPDLGDEGYDKNFYLDDGYMWNRNNKINISLNIINDSIVKGHSVVAGNNRPFVGTFKKTAENTYTVEAKEPGDDKYDGTFTFEVKKGKIDGEWTAFKKIDIRKRKYSLSKKPYKYDPSIQLKYAQRFANWNKVKSEKVIVIDESDGEIVQWFEKEYAMTTDIIYEMNASARFLTKKDIENLKRADLQIIRNTIYARHGYSYKNRIYRIFFDAQDWYIPVHTDIKKELTDIEKKNIQLLLRYEKNADEYYDYFGRG